MIKTTIYMQSGYRFYYTISFHHQVVTSLVQIAPKLSGHYVPSYSLQGGMCARSISLGNASSIMTELLGTLRLSSLNGSPSEENVVEELRILGSSSTVFDLDRNGFNAWPRWLSDLLAAPAALWMVARLGRCSLGSASSMLPSGGVKNGSSGGMCCTVCSDDVEGYELKDGAGTALALRSADDNESTLIEGTFKLRCREAAPELVRE